MNEIPRAKAGLICPLHRKAMAKVCHTCPLWIQMRGKNPNTGQEADEWNCALAWLPMLLVENAQIGRQAGAAVESFRNEMVRTGNRIISMANEKKQMDKPSSNLIGEPFV